MRLVLATFALLLSAAPTMADPSPAAAVAPAAPAAPAAPPMARVAEESAAVSFKDSRGDRVTLRIPNALHRPANHFRLYGMRPLSLWEAGHRRDLYRDAFLELATQSGLRAPTTTWDSLVKQMDWLTGPGKAIPGLPARPADPAKEIAELTRRLAKQPNFGNLNALGQSLGGAAVGAGTDALLSEAREPLTAALQLRALATDQAEQRLLRLGVLSGAEAPGADPALREGYLLARKEFSEVRQGLWPAIGTQLKKSSGKLVFSAAKNLALSRLGWWALFGQLGWQGGEAALGADYQGQSSVALATVGALLTTPRAASAPDDGTLCTYCEYALTYRLTEALKSGQLFGLEPAGGRSTGDWQLRWSTRLGELRQSLAPAPSPAAGS